MVVSDTPRCFFCGGRNQLVERLREIVKIEDQREQAESILRTIEEEVANARSHPADTVAVELDHLFVLGKLRA